ncbi:flagellin [Piscinibacter koreensis]|uniref:Flagellin n=1 Tax=Piscinibacter koreensis TaxID=2742824 RepID=A0A7Y6TWF7_9BURK|nr:flagellin [Schlegelella koreensis]NUZ05946.1 flagellin [Schlegelella koreensis]
MSSTINTNLASLNAQRNSGRTQNELSTAIARLSSGLRINSAKDDAAGLAISDRFTSQIRGINQAARNANDGISLAQTAEGSLASVGENLQRIRELSVQSANATNSASDRASLQLEVAQLVSEIDRVATQTQFNGINLLDGSFTAKAFQVGANAGQTISIASIANARTSALGVYQGFSLQNQSIGTASNTAAALTVTVGSGSAIALGSVAVDAKAIAAAINGGNVAGLTATANATTVAAGTSASNGTTSGTSTFTVNGVAISIAGVAGAGGLSGNRANAVAAINAQSAATGVTASDTGSGVSLTAADGRNIVTSFAAGGFTSATVADFGLGAAATTGSTVNVTYVAPTGTTGNVVFAQTAGFANSTAIGSTGTALSALDISTVAGANAALASVDAALSTVNAGRASLGAVQNRFSSTIENLQVTGENLSASRSRILDADFAQETANLSRAQVLQQAGTAMIAQANQLPQQVLQLLR